MSSHTVWWVADVSDLYEPNEASPKFSSEELARAWQDRAEQTAYAKRLDHREHLADHYEEALLEARTKSGTHKIDLLERSIAATKADNARLASISLADWLVGTSDIALGGWNEKYRIDSEDVLDVLDEI